MAQIKLAVGVPAYGMSITAWQAEMWTKLGFALAHAEARFQLRSFIVVDVCGIDVARNRMVQEAIDADCDWLLMIDADTWHDDGFDLLQMVSTAAHEGATVVAGPVPRRDPDDPHLMVYNAAGQVAKLSATVPLVPIASAATAIMAIDLTFVRHKMTPPWFVFEWTEGSTKPTKSEDLVFCERVLNAGGSIRADTRFRANHLGRTPVHIGDPTRRKL